MNLHKRDTYYNQLSKWLGKGMAVVLTGQRRVGKSCILKQLKNEKEADAGNKNFLVMFCYAYSLKHHSRFDVHHFFNNWLEVKDGGLMV